MLVQISNKELSKIFDLCSKIMELLGENEFKIKTYSIAAFKINKHPVQFYTMNIDEINDSEIISKSIKPKVIEILTTGESSTLQELASQVPEGLLDLLQIKGLGAKKIKVLHDELEIQSIGELLYACQENRLINLKGFGQKTQEKIIDNIKFIQSNNNKYLYAEVEPLLDIILSKCRQSFAHNSFEIAGEYARQNAVISEIHLFSDVSFENFETIITDIFNSEDIAIDRANSCFQLPHCPILIFRNKDFNSGLEIFKLNASPEFLALHLDKITNTQAEKEIEIFENNNLSYIHPAQREIYNNTENLNENLESFDIKGLIHCHSTWSDGSHSIQEMALAAIEKGMEYMVISDHSQAAFYANGLTPDRIADQHREIDTLNEKLAPFRIFKGIEADILYDGQIDYNQNVWESFDVIIASVHSQLSMNEEKATERILHALDNPHVKILGHPTGRLLLSRQGYSLDYEKIFQKCKEKNIVIEVNAHPRRLDLDCSLINAALNHGLILSINSDAHSIEGIDVLKYGILNVQKTHMKAQNNLSSFSLEAFTKHFNL